MIEDITRKEVAQLKAEGFTERTRVAVHHSMIFCASDATDRRPRRIKAQVAGSGAPRYQKATEIQGKFGARDRRWCWKDG